MPTLRLQDLSIRTKVIAGIGSLVAVIFALGLMSFQLLTGLNGVVQATTDNYVVALSQISEMRAEVLNARLALLREVYVAETPEERQAEEQKFRKALEAYDQQEKNYLPTIVTPEERRIYDNVVARKTAYITGAARVHALYKEGETAEAKAYFYSNTLPLAFPIDPALAEDAAFNANGAKAGADDATATYRAGSRAILGLLALGLTAALVVGFVLVRTIAVPVRTMTAAMRRLAGHDFSVAVPGVGRGDEIGAMADAVQVFKDSALHALELEHQQVEARERRTVEDARVRAEAESAAAAEAAHLVVGSIGAGLTRLAAGDLTFRLETGLPEAYEKLRTDLNAALAQLQDAMRSIVGNAHGMLSGTGEITQAADDLSRRTEQQAASLEETAAALDQITATVKRTAENASQVRLAVSKTKADAEHSGGVVQHAVEAMGEIESSSHQIGQIIGVIDEIAFQTNLLALNAGVEAARAGDAGRGFAVVASEVRALAQRSAEAAKEIKALISASAQQVGAGVKLVQETGQALGRIVAQVGEMDGAVGEIAGSAQEQATALLQVNTAVNQMDQVTQQNAAMVEQSTAAAHALAHEAEELARLTARFELGDKSPRHEANHTSSVSPVRRLPPLKRVDQRAVRAAG